MSQLSTLFVRNLVFSGVHGSTGRERQDGQRFRTDLDIRLDISRASASDLLSDTYDYKDAREAVRRVIEGENHVLIEKIADRIARQICQNPKIDSVKVSLRKLNASPNGIPGIVLDYKRSPQEISEKLLDINIEGIIEKLSSQGGVSFPILSEAYRVALLEEAERYEYHRQPEVVGPAKVREQLLSNYSLRAGSLFHRLRDDFEALLEKKLRTLPEYPFDTPLKFNESSLQMYEKGSIGITPHVDGMSYRNLICNFVLTGRAEFALCKDRSGAEPLYLDNSPGNAVIMRAPGFLGSDERPFHFLSEVSERRIVFGLRQKADR